MHNFMVLHVFASSKMLFHTLSSHSPSYSFSILFHCGHTGQVFLSLWFSRIVEQSPQSSVQYNILQWLVWLLHRNVDLNSVVTTLLKLFIQLYKIQTQECCVILYQ